MSDTHYGTVSDFDQVHAAAVSKLRAVARNKLVRAFFLVVAVDSDVPEEIWGTSYVYVGPLAESERLNFAHSVSEATEKALP